jgi:hypothetical protein
VSDQRGVKNPDPELEMLLQEEELVQAQQAYTVAYRRVEEARQELATATVCLNEARKACELAARRQDALKEYVEAFPERWYRPCSP